MIRMFFKGLRAVLGPFMLLWEALSRPRAVVRAPAQQQVVDQQCQGLALYQFATCPFCIKVRQEMHRLALPIERRDTQKDPAHRDALLQGGGAAKVPCLKITDAAGQAQWLYESDAIVSYLSKRFSPT